MMHQDYRETVAPWSPSYKILGLAEASPRRCDSRGLFQVLHSDNFFSLWTK